ncbi:MAG: hypothetical protein ABIT01_21150 [Thermoanaerobaculia bacterium]
MQTEFRTSFDYTARLTRHAFLAYFWRRGAVLAIATPIIGLIAIANLSGRDSGALAGFVLGVLALMWTSWIGAWRQSGRIALSVRQPRVEIVVAADTLTFSSPNVTSTLRWAAIAAVYQTRHFLFVLRPGITNPTPIPSELLPDEVVQLIKTKVREAGGKVR